MKKYLLSLSKILLPVIFTILIINLAFKSLGLFWPFVVAYIIALTVSPLIDWFDNKCKIKPKYASAVLTIIILSLIIIFISYVGITLFHNVDFFIELINKIFKNLKEIKLPFGLNFKNISDLILKNISTLSQYVSTAISGATSGIKAIPDIFFKIIITILASYFLIADRKRISRFVFNHINETAKEKLLIILDESKILVNAYIISQIKIMLGVALILFIGFMIFGFKLSIVIPLVAVIAFLDFLPVFGSGTILIPWFLYLFLIGNYKLGTELLILYVIVTIFRQVVSPKVVGEEVGLAPFPSLILMYAGYVFYGLTGLIFAIPVGVLVSNLYKNHFFDSFISNINSFIDDTKNIFNTKK